MRKKMKAQGKGKIKYYEGADGVKHHYEVGDSKSRTEARKKAEKAGEKKEAQEVKHVRTRMRKLWYDHVAWTRMTIIETLNSLEGLTLKTVPKSVASAYTTLIESNGTRIDIGSKLPGSVEVAYNRLQKNQVQLGELFGERFGSKAGHAVQGLLQQHIGQSVVIVVSLKLEDSKTFKDFAARWEGNGKQIADALHSLNPGWPQKTLREALHMHLETTTAELLARYNKKWGKDVEAFDVALNHMLGVADVLSSGF
jgi:hypothetical protein